MIFYMAIELLGGDKERVVASEHPIRGGAYVEPVAVVTRVPPPDKRCDCGCGPLNGLLAGMNDGYEIQTCDDCPERFDTDEEAAQELARAIDGTTHEYDDERFEVLDVMDRPIFWRTWNH